MKVKNMQPTTWREAYQQLDALLTAKEQAQLATCSVDDLLDYHFGLGMWIRNKWIHGHMAPFLEKERDIIYIPDIISEMVIKRYRSVLRRRKILKET